MNDKYLHYQLEDFLTDDTFIASISDASLESAWSTWLQDHPDMATRIHEAKELIHSLKFKEEVFTSQAQVWDRIEQSTSAKEISMTPVRSQSRPWVWIAIAAAACIGLLVFLRSPEQGMITRDNMSIVSENVVLPSGSEIVLAPGSSVSYDQSLWKAERYIQLTGEASFDVTTGVPFIVETSNGSVRVLGTQFSIDAQGKSFIVQVSEGKVEVSSGTQKEILTAGMNFKKNPSYKDVSANHAQSDDQEEKVLNFYQYEDAPLSDIILSIEREYNVTFTANSSIKEKLYTGFFKSDNLEIALNSVFWPLNIKYEINDKTIILSEE
jgi:transmembrane sensor